MPSDIWAIADGATGSIGDDNCNVKSSPAVCVAPNSKVTDLSVARNGSSKTTLRMTPSRDDDTDSVTSNETGPAGAPSNFVLTRDVTSVQ